MYFSSRPNQIKSTRVGISPRPAAAGRWQWHWRRWWHCWGETGAAGLLGSRAERAHPTALGAEQRPAQGALGSESIKVVLSHN